ncbi:Transposon Ty3-G Gag-Pol polyprotein [Gossypium australe]|uniref:Transposon Ty3-G Gag-Pol polyprotein n=1 Tax=Gossypium australe TaxID=47621 RepID=A0A5B6UTX4_9ROSI|nr:Transposon Ty3-G Gag-Pol polyprotein [Gossypium australe]
MGPELLQEMEEKKSYVDLKRNGIEFSVGGKEVLERIGPVAYKLALHPNLAKIQNIFHVYMLRKYSFNPFHDCSSESVTAKLYSERCSMGKRRDYETTSTTFHFK